MFFAAVLKALLCYHEDCIKSTPHILELSTNLMFHLELQSNIIYLLLTQFDNMLQSSLLQQSLSQQMTK